MKKNILITGANGQLGKSLQRIYTDFYQDYFTLFLTDIETLDITKKDEIENFVLSHRIDSIVNVAAYTSVDKAESEIETAFLLNETAVENLAFVSQKMNLFLVHISTDYVFDGKSITPYRTDSPTNPISIYGKSKAAGEEKMLHLGLHGAIIRTSWLYSIYGNNFFKTMLRLGKEKKELQVVNDQYGAPTYAPDLAKAIFTMIQKSDTFAGVHIFHYANEGVTTWYEFAQNIFKKAQLPCQVTPVSTASYLTPAARPHYSVFDLSKIKTQFAISIPSWQTSLDAAIQETTDSERSVRS